MGNLSGVFDCTQVLLLKFNMVEESVLLKRGQSFLQYFPERRAGCFLLWWLYVRHYGHGLHLLCQTLVLTPQKEPILIYLEDLKGIVNFTFFIGGLFWSCTLFISCIQYSSLYAYENNPSKCIILHQIKFTSMNFCNCVCVDFGDFLFLHLCLCWNIKFLSASKL